MKARKQFALFIDSDFMAVTNQDERIAMLRPARIVFNIFCELGVDMPVIIATYTNKSYWPSPVKGLAAYRAIQKYET